MNSLGVDVKSIEKIANQVAQKVVKESQDEFKKLEDSSIHGKLFVQLGIEKKLLNKKVKKVFKEMMQKPKKSPMKREEVLYQQFQAKQAIQSLENE